MNITNTALVVALGLACVRLAAKPTWVTMDANSIHHYQSASGDTLTINAN